MKNPLGKTEITGLVLLALVMAGVTAGAFLMRGSSDEGGSMAPGPEITVVDTVPAPAETKEAAAPTPKRKKRKKKKTPRKASETQPARVDPFSDTVPVY